MTQEASTIMKSLRYALLTTCCLAVPALAQQLQVPALPPTMPAAMGAPVPLATGQPTAKPLGATPAIETAPMQGNTSAAVPRTMPPSVDQVAPDKPLSAKQKAAVAVARTWINHWQQPHLDGDGVEHFTVGLGEVQVVAAVNHVTDIALAPGEIINPPLHIGDADEWKMTAAMSGAGRHMTAHVLVKPIDAGLNTNLVIETNKRTISVSLTSRRQDYMPMVSLDIPADDAGGFGAPLVLAGANPMQQPSPCDLPPTVPPDQFIIKGDNVSWKPTQAFIVSTPVGDKTCIDFPSSIGSDEIPALLALADDGGWFSSPTKKIINVRFLRRRFIADESLSRMILVSGVGGDQKQVKITRRHM